MKFLVCLLLGLATANAQGYAYATHDPLGYAHLGGYRHLSQAYSPVFKTYTGYSPAHYNAYAPLGGNFKYAFTTPHDGVVAYNHLAAAPAPVAAVTHVEAAAPLLKTVAYETAPAVVAAPAPAVYAPGYTAKAQYHEQNQLGEYKFGYIGDTSAREEVRAADGSVAGHYTYLDSNNIPQKVNYVADAAGFRVAATNLPVDPNHPIAPVAAATSGAYVAAAPLARHYVAAAPVVAYNGDAINPHVPYTPEVAQARALHFAAVNDAVTRAKRSADPAGYNRGGYKSGRSSYKRGGYNKGYGGSRYGGGYRSGSYKKY